MADNYRRNVYNAKKLTPAPFKICHLEQRHPLQISYVISFVLSTRLVLVDVNSALTLRRSSASRLTWVTCVHFSLSGYLAWCLGEGQGYGKDWLAVCQDIVTEWEIRVMVLATWSSNNLIYLPLTQKKGRNSKSSDSAA